MRVQALPPALAARIAAGESVNRPCSVIKELLENSIDAGATQVRIQIKHGGIKHISIRDNGKGIHPDDLPLAISRYCTSKIRSDSDLEKVMSLGFRGEALASIAAVARLTIRSKQDDQEQGYSLHVEGSNDAGDVTPCSQQQGTSIVVEDLFFNVPARRKFLRKPNTERQHVLAIVQQTALAHPNVAITLMDEDRELLALPAANSREASIKRIGKVLGKDFENQSHYIQSIDAGLSLEGWLGNPSLDKQNMDFQYFYINGRFVKDKVVRHAIRAAYEDVLFNGRHPCYVLFLDIPPQSVDVNVHPTKHEVRFRDQHMVHAFLKQAVSDALGVIAPGHTVRLTETPQTSTTQASMPTPVSVQREAVSRASESTPRYHSMPSAPSYTRPAPPLNHESAPTPQTLDLPSHDEKKSGFATAIAQLHQLYILAQNDSGLVIIDMHAAHERVLYEEMKHQYDNNRLEVQPLLIPETIELDNVSFLAWEESKEALLACGIETEAIAENTCAIRSLPAMIKPKDAQGLVRALIAETMDVNQTGDVLTARVHAMFGNIACKGAIKANQQLTLPQMQALLDDMADTPRSGLCNHGRPTVMMITIKELDSFFMRGQ